MKRCLKVVFQSIIFPDSWWPAWQPGLWLFSTLTSTSGTMSSSRDTRLSRKCPERTSVQPRSRSQVWIARTRSSLDLNLTVRTVQQNPNPLYLKGFCVQLSFTSKGFVAIITPCGRISVSNFQMKLSILWEALLVEGIRVSYCDIELSWLDRNHSFGLLK